MGRKKIVWLCSWYPSCTDPFNGDFIQRHARAAALYNDIHVIHVAADEANRAAGMPAEISKGEGLTEEILYFEKKRTLISRLLAPIREAGLYRKAIRRYISEHGTPDLVHVHIPMKAGLQALWVRKKFGVPYAVTEHWGIYNDVEKLNYSGRSVLFKKTTTAVFKNAAAFMSVSRYLAEGVCRLVVNISYEIIPNVTDTSLFYPCTARQANKPFRFIHVSNMVPLKNVKGILRAFRQLLNEGALAELVLLGNPDNQYPQMAVELGLPASAVYFRGEVPYPQVANEMRNADALVVFSDIENSPCVIGEAGCCGLPVIATRTGGIPELIDDSNGLLVTPGDETELLSAMKTMLEKKHAFSNALIAGQAKNKFSYNQVGRQMDAVYNRCVR